MIKYRKANKKDAILTIKLCIPFEVNRHVTGDRPVVTSLSKIAEALRPPPRPPPAAAAATAAGRSENVKNR